MHKVRVMNAQLRLLHKTPKGKHADLTYVSKVVSDHCVPPISGHTLKPEASKFFSSQDKCFGSLFIYPRIVLLSIRDNS